MNNILTYHGKRVLTLSLSLCAIAVTLVLALTGKINIIEQSIIYLIIIVIQNLVYKKINQNKNKDEGY